MSQESEPTYPISTSHAAFMFWLSLLFLAIVGIITQWWNTSKIVEADTRLTGWIMLAIWLPFVLEAIVGYLFNRRLGNNLKRLLMVLVLPPLRMTYSTFHDERAVWLPGIGWARRDESLYDRVERFSTMPMLIIAIMILPVLGLEFLLKERVAEIPLLDTALTGCTVFIWFAFALEFILEASLTKEKLAYCKRNWLNLVIILLPLISFLRGFQVVRAFRVARAGKLLRVYRMRSLLLRIYQTLIAISAVERFLNRDPEKHLAKLQKLHDEKELELHRLRAKMDEVRTRMQAEGAKE